MKRSLFFSQRGVFTTFLILLSFLSNAQEKIIVTGKVTDVSGKPLEGASIQNRDAKKSVLSNKDGHFQIDLPSENSTITISFIGYEEQIYVVGKQRQITIALKAVANAMNEVIVIGYGTSKRRDLTGSVSSFSAKGIEETPVTRIDQAMIGQMAGVQIKQQTGMPGQSLGIAIRGTGSISSGTDPLYVIDGFPLDVVSQNSAGGYTSNPLNNLNPDDIESIQVLKDAASAAIYGSRAANGVVMITTKKGQTGKPKFTINANTGFSQASRKMDVLSAEEWISMATELADYKWVNSASGRTASQTNAERRAILGLGPTAYNLNFMPDDRWSIEGHPGLNYVDWQDEAFRKAQFQKYQVSASGGTEAVKYYFSGGFINQDGVLIGSGYKNFSARANVEVNASKRLKFGLNLAPSYSETNLPNAEGKDNQLMKLFNMVPIVEDTAGLETGAGKNSVYSWATGSPSPIAYLKNSIALAKTNRVLYSVFGELQLVKNLSLRTTVNYDDQNLNRKTYVSDYVASNITNFLNSPGKGSSGSYNGNKKQVLVNENTLSYNSTFGKIHSINAVAGFTYNSVHVENFTMSTAGGFANNIVTTLNGAIPSSAGVTITGNTTESNNTMLSYYGRAIYNLAGKYTLQASIRRDASSRFGKDSRWGTFPSASFAWNISQEKFMEKLSIINDLKLRGSWGRSGSYSISDYATQQSFNASNYSFGGSSSTSAVSGVVIGALTDQRLHWETSNTYNAGLDVTVLNNRINVVAEAYYKKSTELFLRVPIPAASGFNTYLTNIGAVGNKGYEFTVNTTNVKNKRFTWTTSANFSYNSNKLISLNAGTDIINIPAAYSGNPPFLLQTGLPMYSYYMIESDGILSSEDMANPKVAKLPGQTVGDLKYKDANPDGKIDVNDRVLVGQPNAKYYWGLTNNFKYRNFDLNVRIYGQMGGKIISFVGRALDNPSTGRGTTLGVWRDRWTPDNQNYNAPRGKFGYNYTIPLFTTDWLYSSDFWRIQDITLGYNIKKLGNLNIFNNARLYASLQNFFGRDKYKGGANPEAQNTNVSGNSDYPLPGDYGSMPLSKTITFGINVSF